MLLRFFSLLLMPLVVLGFTLGLAQANTESSLQTLPFKVFSKGLSSSEAERVKLIFDSYSVIDLQKSGTPALAQWLEAVTERLSRATESLGSQFASYRVLIILSDEPTGFIQKFRPAGQNFFKGYVFLSTGLIHQMAKTLGGSFDQLPPESLKTLEQGLIGVLAHEFSHPKQDELVKWQWRAEQDHSRQSHSQADEMTTDIMAVQLLRKAQLPAENLLIGLQLLLGDRPQTGSAAQRAAFAAVSSHPEDTLRLNILRAALTRFRMEEGVISEEPLSVPFGPIQHELAPFLDVNPLDQAAREAFKGAPPTLNGILEHLKGTLLKSNGNVTGKQAYLQALKNIKELYRNKAPTADEVQSFIAFNRQLLTAGYSQGLFEGAWFSIADNGSSEVIGTFINRDFFRKIQKESEDLPLLNHPAYEQWFKDTLLTLPLENAIPDFEKVGLLNLGFLLRQKELAQVFRRTLDEVGIPQSRLNVRHYLQIWTWLSFMNEPDLEIEVLEKLAIFQERFGGRWIAQEQSGFSQILDPEHLELHLRMIGSSTPEKQLRIIQLSAGLFEGLLRAPRNSHAALLNFSSIDDSGALSLMFWSITPEHHFNRIRTGEPVSFDSLGAKLRTILETPDWRETIQKALQGHSDTLESELLGLWLPLIRSGKSPFATPSKLNVLEPILQSYDELIPAALAGDKKANSHWMGLTGYHCPKEVRQELLFRFLRNAKQLSQLDQGIKTVWSYLHTPQDRVEIFSLAQKLSIISQEDFSKLIFSQVLKIQSRDLSFDLSFLRGETAHQMWKTLAQTGMSPNERLSTLVQIFSLNRSWDQLLGSDIQNQLTGYRDMGLQVHPLYSTFLSRITPILVRDFLASFKVKKGTSVNDPAYQAAFRSHYAKVLQFLRQIFNPDLMPIRNEDRAQVHYGKLDTLAAEIIPLIPAQILTEKERKSLWEMFSAKRANRYTDQFFIRWVFPQLETLETTERLKAFETILGHGRIESERLKNQLYRPLLSEKISQLLTDQKQGITDAQIFSLLNDLQYHVEESSGFKDDLLELIAWQLELTESQVARFIEPMKSFNYKKMDVSTVNLLSTTSVLIGSLSRQERLQFVRYILEPKGDLFKALPSLGQNMEKLTSLLQEKLDLEPSKSQELLGKLESFIRDSNVSERMVLIEMLVGSRGYGLWHQGPEMREELYALAGLTENGTKRALFETYLQALPTHEHTITLSYLIAHRTEAVESELLAILQLFQAPGDKFAQIASILGTFGPEESKKLAKAKSQSRKLSKAEVFHLLRTHLPEQEFLKIKSIKKILGSASIKCVVLVEYKDGTRGAVYLRRAFLEQTNESTLQLAERWMALLKEHPDFAGQYDYDYYLQTLREQLKMEVQFLREKEASEKMSELYDTIPPQAGWKFKTVKPLQDRTQNKEILQFTAIENAVPFEMLSEPDQQIVSKYLLSTELSLLFKKGIFDADRHSGNYLFDPASKTIFPIDFGQVYVLKSNRFTQAGDFQYLARIIYGLYDKNPRKGAKLLASTFVQISTNRQEHKIGTEARLAEKLETILQSQEELNLKLLKILAELNTTRVRIPMELSLGVFKDLMILLNESYAKVAGPEFIQKRVEAFVRSQMILKPWYDWVTSPVKKHAQMSPCESPLVP